MPTTLNSGLQLPDKGSVDWYSSMQNNYGLLDNHLENTDIHVTAEDKANWDSKQGSLSQAQLDAIVQVATNTNDIATLQSDKADASHTHSSSDITDIDDYATKDYVDNSISGLVDNAPDALNTLNELSAALNDDSNFASTVTTALATKVNSADLATVATTGDYDDLDNKPDLKPVATSGDYDDLTDLPAYGIIRFSSSAITDNSSVAFSAISSTNKIKVGDFILDTNGKLYQISAVDTSNETVTVTTPFTQLAVDANVMHLSGNETANGIKTFKDMIPIDGDYLGNEASTNQRTNICLRSNRDTADKSCAFITRFRQNRSQGALQPLDLQKIGFDVLENGVRTNNVFDIQCTDWLNDVPQRVNFISSAQSYSYGKSTVKALFNDLNPGALSLPDLNNGIDISGYLDTSQSSSNTYTPVVDGWISIKGRSSSTSGIAIIQDGMVQMGYNLVDFGSSDRISFCALPVKAGVQVTIWLKTVTSFDSAKFFPCQGNV